MLQAYVLHPNAVDKILNELTTRYEGQTSGFTRRFRLASRKGDGAPQVVIQLTKSVLLPETKPTSQNSKETVVEPTSAEVTNV
jgi:hypothetical protein